MKEFIVERFFQNEHKTLSECMVVADGGYILFEFKGIELPWNNNKRGISCIPVGEYSAIAVRRWSNKKYALWVQDVPGRSEIMVHTANFVKQLLGCLAPGREFKDIDNDGIIDVTSSQATMDEIEKHIPLGEEVRYIVINKEKPNKIPTIKPNLSFIKKICNHEK